jgi:hypothetical protein
LESRESKQKKIKNNVTTDSDKIIFSFPMNDQKTALLVAIVLGFFLVVPLSITSIVLSQTKDSSCDVKDEMGLNVANWLLGQGITILVFWAALIVAFFAPAISLALIIVDTLFSTSWFVVGGIILFRSNIDCINEGGTMIIYALVMWCLMAIQIIGRQQQK